MSWKDQLAQGAQGVIDWLARQAQRGEQRRMVLRNREGEVLWETSLTLVVSLGILAFIFFLPLALLLVGLGWWLGYRLVPAAQ